mmetsp:Transcript_101962/g.186798  ORF Transcript_101962/g.186798 Transcript_101962/m.186798 type:complete len:438 (+) Transcript_101962:28-1341(+)
MPEQVKVAHFGPNLWEVARGCGLPFQCDDAPTDTVVENIFIPETLWSDMPAVHVGSEWQPVSVSEVRDDICQEHRPVPLLLPPRHLRKWAARASPRHSPWKRDTGSVMTEYAPEVVGEPVDRADVDAEVQKEVPGKPFKVESHSDGIMTESSEISLTRTPRRESSMGLSFSKCEFKRIKERAPEVVVPEPVIDDAMLADAQAEAEARAKALMDHAGDDLPELFCRSDTLWEDTWSVADEDLVLESPGNAVEPIPATSMPPLAASAVASSAAASASPVLTASDYTVRTKAFKALSPLTRISAGAECEAASAVVAGEIASSRTDAESTGASEGSDHAGASEAGSDSLSSLAAIDGEVQLTVQPAAPGASQPKQELGQSNMEVNLKADGRFPQAPSCVVELLGGHPRPLAFAKPADAVPEASSDTPEQAQAVQTFDFHSA